MQNFRYKAKDSRKEMITGILEAETEQEALAKLSQMGYFPLSIEREEASSEGQTDPLSLGFFTRIRRRDITVFTRQLADLLEAGLPLMRGLDVLWEQTDNRRLQEVLASLATQVKEGKSFSQALTLYPKIFSNLYVNMVKSGEVGGMLSEVLARLADFGENEEELRAKVRAALAYPILILFVGMATVAVLLIFVVRGPNPASSDSNLDRIKPRVGAFLVGRPLHGCVECLSAKAREVVPECSFGHRWSQTATSGLGSAY
jgi:type II secretory pathway component PulF